MNKDISHLHTFVVCAYKESSYLENCIRSVLRQTCKSTVILSTGTPNEHISRLAEKYRLPLFVSDQPSSIANDWNFALSCARTELVTLAHQDDFYEKDYSAKVLAAYHKAKEPIVIFSDYSELRGKKRVRNNRLLKVKRMMLLPLRLPLFWQSRFVRRRILSLGNAICCPAVTYVKEHIAEPLFIDNMKSNIDWQAWEQLSRQKGSFVYVPESLMLHRIHEESTTSSLIENQARKEEDMLVFRKFWPEPMVKLIEWFYQKSEKSNRV